MSPSLTRWGIPRDADFAVTYQDDPTYHDHHPDDTRVAACDVHEGLGLVTSRRRAERAGLAPCPRCFPRDHDSRSQTGP